MGKTRKNKLSVFLEIGSCMLFLLGIGIPLMFIGMSYKTPISIGTELWMFTGVCFILGCLGFLYYGYIKPNVLERTYGSNE